ncbi:putative acetyltransferase [Paenibacillus sp. UNCCL117]|uniref:N-acetyltransferase n=1 Tax=unclassified Paenibacillus TaxID=185978 RepID=UPI000881996B|nr:MULTISPECIES: N-acetyltransferase [unclassified Paenibacillus]SDD86596.1 putative acetyltransferase [Paenibacillus sp. cl123]SFW54126.1 putative acetyltransferase [Paenibacillus sp. UNCCL117]
MKIRPFQLEDMEPVLDIWFKGSVTAHDFIQEEYWASMRPEMKNKYLPMSKTYVIDQETKIVGFVSMVDNYLAALFIDVSQQKKGYGKQLLDFVKKQHETITLRVYQRNANAINFYCKNGFEILQEEIDENTSQKEFSMRWSIL